MRKGMSYPVRTPEGQATDTAVHALVQLLTTAMATWAATLRLTVVCVALVLATAAAVIIVNLLGR